MKERGYELTMKKSDQILGFNLYLRDWSIPELSKEIGRNPATVRQWARKFDWRMRKKRELRDIEQEMRDKVFKAREKIIDVATMTIDDIIIKDSDGKPTQVSVGIEDVKDLRVVAELLLKVGGVPDKVEQTVTKEIKGEVTLKTEQISPEMATEIGRVLALKNSVDGTDGDE